MEKIEKDYELKYGDIPESQIGRINFLINTIKGKRRKNKLQIFKELNRINEIEWEEYKFTIYLVPKSTPRPRSNFNSRIFYVKGSAINKKIFRKFIKLNPRDIIITPTELRVVSYLPTPSTMCYEEKLLAEMGYIRPLTIPDFDNLAKTYADMMKDTLLYDDSLVMKGLSEKYYSIKPRIEITLRYMKDFDSLFNLNKYIKKKGSK